jgi:outer membrane protein OmpA-like peptidoglycan-associated protein
MTRLASSIGAVLAFSLLPALGFAAGIGQPDTNEIIEKLTPPKASDLTATSRGIRAAPSATPSDTPHQSREPAAAPAEAPSIDLAIPFGTGSATLEPEGVKIVGALGHALASPALSDSKFRIEGHADTVGEASANLALSQRRASAVASILAKRYGIPADRLTAIGVGSENLVVQTGDQVAEPRNRVVRIVNLGPG